MFEFGRFCYSFQPESYVKITVENDRNAHFQHQFLNQVMSGFG